MTFDLSPDGFVGILAADNPQTLRQLHYAIFSRRQIAYDNTQPEYKRLSRATTVARRAYREWELAGSDEAAPRYSFSSEWMVDETREPEMVNVWRNSDEYIDAVKRSYRRDNWQTQPRHCEVWSEKGTIMGAIRPVATELGITLRVCHGFGSTGMEAQIGGLFNGIRKPITVFYLGDHDPSGHVIERDIHRRAEAASGVSFAMLRLAIHESDIRLFNLPPQTIKVTDSRAASFRREFGQTAATVELDALPASELRRRIDDAVRALIDFDLWNRQVAVQNEELKCIAEFAQHMRNLPQLRAVEREMLGSE